MPAVFTAHAGEAMGQNPAFEITPQFPFGVGRDALFLPVVPAQGEEGFQMILHYAVQRRFGGATR